MTKPQQNVEQAQIPYRVLNSLTKLAAYADKYNSVRIPVLKNSYNIKNSGTA